MNKIIFLIKNILMRYKFLLTCESAINFKGKIAIQLFSAFSFLILSITNIFAESYLMLVATMFGCFICLITAFIAIKTKKIKYSVYSSIILCSLTFATFVVIGGNDGFASLWIALLPIFAMAIMDFMAGFITSIVLQIFLIIVFWTPVNDLLLYQYNQQFCLRFPVFFFVSVSLGFVMTIFLQKSQYDAQMYLSELEKATEIANNLAKIDPLTGLANRRSVFDIFNSEQFDGKTPHCIVMGDIDGFKKFNDTHGHQFGDEVLVKIAEYINSLLPEDYIKSRWGGEEFLIAAKDDIDNVYENIEKLRIKISEHDFFYGGIHYSITISFGIVQFFNKEEMHNAISIADKNLYISKKMGRNRTTK